MGYPGEPPRRQPHDGTDTSRRGDGWFDAPPRSHPAAPPSREGPPDPVSAGESTFPHLLTPYGGNDPGPAWPEPPEEIGRRPPGPAGRTSGPPQAFGKPLDPLSAPLEALGITDPAPGGPTGPLPAAPRPSPGEPTDPLLNPPGQAFGPTATPPGSPARAFHAPAPTPPPGEAFGSPPPGEAFGTPPLGQAFGTPGEEPGGPRETLGGPWETGGHGQATRRPAGEPPTGPVPAKEREPGNQGFVPPATAARAVPPSPAKGRDPVTIEPERRREMWSPYDEGPRSRRPLYISLAALVFLIAGGVGLSYMASADPDTSATADASVPQSSPSPLPPAPQSKDGFAASRATDKFPLTLKEVFPGKKLSIKGATYHMTVRRMDKTCKDAATGEKLHKALTDGKCNQLLRASFRDRSGEIIGTVGVANLRNAKAANKVVAAAAGGKLEDYVKPLPGKDEHTKSLGSGQANAGAWRQGHYAVLLWFQFKDGHTPTKAERKKLTEAAINITDATVFPALDSRALTGRRPG